MLSQHPWKSYLFAVLLLTDPTQSKRVFLGADAIQSAVYIQKGLVNNTRSDVLSVGSVAAENRSRILLKFDMDHLSKELNASIQQVESASLILTCLTTYGKKPPKRVIYNWSKVDGKDKRKDGYLGNIHVSEILKEWDQDTVSWIHRNGDELWDIPYLDTNGYDAGYPQVAVPRDLDNSTCHGKAFKIPLGNMLTQWLVGAERHHGVLIWAEQDTTQYPGVIWFMAAKDSIRLEVQLQGEQHFYLLISEIPSVVSGS